MRYIKKHKLVFYDNMLISGKLNGYPVDLNGKAKEVFSQLVKELAEKEGITEALKAAEQMAWVGAMNNIRNRATEMVDTDLIYA